MSTVSMSDLRKKLILELFKPDHKTIFGRIVHFTESPRITKKLGTVNEINFTIPYYITKDFIKIINPIAGRVLAKDHVRVTDANGEQEWYVVVSTSKSYDSDGSETMQVTLYSLPYTLGKKKILAWIGAFVDGEYRIESLNAYQALDAALEETPWSIDYIDSKYLTTYKTVDLSGGITVLDAVHTIAEMFKATIIWDTLNRKISLRDIENIGTNKGLTFEAGKYLKSIDTEETDEIITRLYPTGADGITIHSVNPTGSGFIEDYSFFMQGFERDSNKRVISSSIYMSDALCHALLDHKEYVDSQRNDYQTLVGHRDRLNKSKSPIELELFNAEVALSIAEDQLDIKQTNNQETKETQAEITRLLEVVGGLESQLEEIDNQIEAINMSISHLSGLLSLERFLTPELAIELSEGYDHMETFDDGDYTTPQELYDAALKHFEDVNRPPKVINIDIVNLLNIIGKENATGRFNLGDKFYIKHPLFKVDHEAQLIEYEIDYDSNSISIVIANIDDVNDDLRIAKMHSNSLDVGKSLASNLKKLNDLDERTTEVSEFLKGNIDAAKKAIVAGVNNTVTINERGITLTSTDNPQEFIRMTNAVIGLTEDNGNTFKTAITPRGITAEYLAGSILIGENLFMQSKNGNLFRFDDNGVMLDGSALTITNGGITGNHLSPEFIDSVFQFDKEYSNGVRIDDTGLTVVRSDGSAMVNMSATDGIKFRSRIGSQWKDDFYFDPINKNYVFNGVLNALDMKIDGKSVLTEDKLIKGSFIKSISTDQLTAGNAKITTAMIESLEVGRNVYLGANATISYNQVTNKPTIPQTPEQIGALPANSSKLTHITANGIYSGTLSGNTINGATINGGIINVDTDVNVGQNIYLLRDYSNRFSEKSILFNSGDTSFISKISGTYLTLELQASTIRLKGHVDFSGATVAGLNISTTAKFA